MLNIVNESTDPPRFNLALEEYAINHLHPRG